MIILQEVPYGTKQEECGTSDPAVRQEDTAYCRYALPYGRSKTWCGRETILRGNGAKNLKFHQFFTKNHSINILNQFYNDHIQFLSYPRGYSFQFKSV